MTILSKRSVLFTRNKILIVLCTIITVTVLWIPNPNEFFDEVNFKNYKGEFRQNESEPFQKVTQKDSFWVLNNFVKANQRPKRLESITYTVPASFPFLDNIPFLIERWKGPISVAVFSPGDDFYRTLQSIAYLRRCKTELIEQFVTFHIFFPEEHIPKSSLPLLTLYEDKVNCSNNPFSQNEDTYRKKNNLLFPINTARNIAKDNAETYLIFPSDIELYPSLGFIEKFLKMFTSIDEQIHERSVYVTPVFEIREGQDVPESKATLRAMINDRKAQFFHITMCKECHTFPSQEKWILENETKELGIFATTKKTGSYIHWEPFYVAVKSNMPDFPEKITWEGLSDKIVQAYILCLLNFDFHVLNNVYLTHKPGIKKHRQSPQKAIQNNNNYKRGVLRSVLETIYGSRQGCSL